MRVCVTFRTPDGLPDIEERVFAFTHSLEEVCDSIESCTVVAEGPVPVGGDMKAWSARITLELFGEEVKILGIGSMTDSAAALNLALRDALAKAARKLEVVALSHSACACNHPHSVNAAIVNRPAPRSCAAHDILAAAAHA